MIVVHVIDRITIQKHLTYVERTVNVFALNTASVCGQAAGCASYFMVLMRCVKVFVFGLGLFRNCFIEFR